MTKYKENFGWIGCLKFKKKEKEKTTAIKVSNSQKNLTKHFPKRSETTYIAYSL